MNSSTKPQAKRHIGQILIDHGILTEDQLRIALLEQMKSRLPVGRRFATILTSAAGDPLDKTYYQTVKGMVTPLDILAPGGTLIVASACSEASARTSSAPRRRGSRFGGSSTSATVEGSPVFG